MASSAVSANLQRDKPISDCALLISSSIIMLTCLVIKPDWARYAALFLDAVILSFRLHTNDTPQALAILGERQQYLPSEDFVHMSVMTLTFLITGMSGGQGR